ncbi:MAG: DUF2807 domain-containing protein [Prolixibacteraceae bacterium]|jgi:hypothetical protein|nr:DUF2807 domain-containing protein [Prolixibacteraceae bacterium]NLO00835.1 hypothetical protein [Bacteroidales bacterium]
MKNYWFILVFVFGIAIMNGCMKEDVIYPNGTELEVESFENVSVNGQVKVIFNNQSTNLKFGQIANSNDFRVNVTAPGDLKDHVQINSQGGLLTITADEDVDISDSVEVEIWSAELDEIRLENDQVAEFFGNFNQEELTVVTEARSKLSLFGVQVDKLYCKTEGQSEFVLTTSAEIFEGTQSYEEPRGIQIDEFTLLVDSSFVVVGDSIKLEDEMWIVYGDEIFETFEMAYCDFKTEGETFIDAQDATAQSVNINLEGQSEAMVWATKMITGKGEGSSILYFRNVEGVDLGGFITEGSAEILPFE